jgi:hypothetical protein
MPQPATSASPGCLRALEYRSLRVQWISRAGPGVISSLQVTNVLSTGIHQQLRRTGA